MHVVAAGVREAVRSGEGSVGLLPYRQGVELRPHCDGVPRRADARKESRARHGFHALRLEISKHDPLWRAPRGSARGLACRRSRGSAVARGSSSSRGTEERTEEVNRHSGTARRPLRRSHLRGGDLGLLHTQVQQSSKSSEKPGADDPIRGRQAPPRAKRAGDARPDVPVPPLRAWRGRHS